MSVYDGLVDDARLRAGGDPGVDVAPVAGAWVAHAWVASLVVPDTWLAGVERVAAEGLPVTVVNSGGAGGLLALARRDPQRLSLLAVESELRDLDDLAGNAARVAAAAGELAEQVRVFVGLPCVPGWERAVDVVEAAGLSARVSLDDLAAQAPVLIEADLPFKVTGGRTRAQLDAALTLVRAIVDEAEVPGPPAAWSDQAAARVRRRLARFDLVDPAAWLSGA